MDLSLQRALKNVILGRLFYFYFVAQVCYFYGAVQYSTVQFAIISRKTELYLYQGEHLSDLTLFLKKVENNRNASTGIWRYTCCCLAHCSVVWRGAVRPRTRRCALSHSLMRVLLRGRSVTFTLLFFHCPRLFNLRENKIYDSRNIKHEPVCF